MKPKKTQTRTRGDAPGSLKREVMRWPETPLQEVQRMKLIMRHFRKLTMPSRDFVKWLMEKYATDQLPEAA